MMLILIYHLALRPGLLVYFLCSVSAYSIPGVYVLVSIHLEVSK